VIALSADQAKQISDFRWSGRIPTGNEAIRHLLDIGLAAAQSQQKVQS
jgi:hypothetical protein